MRRTYTTIGTTKNMVINTMMPVRRTSKQYVRCTTTMKEMSNRLNTYQYVESASHNTTNKMKYKKGNIYHLYNRVAHREKIFLNDNDYRFLLRRIKKYFKRDEITMIAYCLMPNHYHFLVRQDGYISISNTWQAIFNSYSKAFNVKHAHSGTIFQGSVKSTQILEEEVFQYICRYIHRNPVAGKNPLVKNVEDWMYSNYPEWIGLRNGSLFDENILQEFGGRREYRQYVQEEALKPEQLKHAYLMD